jgi:centrosomal protein CEP104
MASALLELPWKLHECTSEDPNFLALQLASDYTRQIELGGWASRKFCEFPQSLTLRLHSPSNLRQIKLLSHEFKIASRVEL